MTLADRGAPRTAYERLVSLGDKRFVLVISERLRRLGRAAVIIGVLDGSNLGIGLVDDDRSDAIAHRERAVAVVHHRDVRPGAIAATSLIG